MQNEGGVQLRQPTRLSCPLGSRKVQPRPGTTAPVIVTVLEPGMRGLVNVAVRGTLSPVHVQSPEEGLHAARRHSAQALLVSPGAIRREHVPTIARVVAGCPGLQKSPLF